MRVGNEAANSDSSPCEWIYCNSRTGPRLYEDAGTGLVPQYADPDAFRTVAFSGFTVKLTAFPNEIFSGNGRWLWIQLSTVPGLYMANTDRHRWVMRTGPVALTGISVLSCSVFIRSIAAMISLRRVTWSLARHRRCRNA